MINIDNQCKLIKNEIILKYIDSIFYQFVKKHNIFYKENNLYSY